MSSWERVQAIGLELPGVTVSTLYSTQLAELIEESWRLRATAALRGQRP